MTTNSNSKATIKTSGGRGFVAANANNGIGTLADAMRTARENAEFFGEPVKPLAQIVKDHAERAQRITRR